jgi:hypothetical protein
MADSLSGAHYRLLRPHLVASLLRQEIENNPKYIEDWSAYSQNKRTSGGWWLEQTSTGWDVGRFGHSPAEPAPHAYFASGSEATADYVLRELDFWDGQRRSSAPASDDA